MDGKTSTQIVALAQEVQEKKTLLTADVCSSAETEELLATVGSLTTERDQLKMDLRENIEMVGDLPSNIPTHTVDQIFLCFTFTISCILSLR